MKYWYINEYFDIETGETVDRKEVLEGNYKTIKTIKTDVRHTAECTTTSRKILVKRDAQLKIGFPDSREEGD